MHRTKIEPQKCGSIFAKKISNDRINITVRTKVLTTDLTTDALKKWL